MMEVVPAQRMPAAGWPAVAGTDAGGADTHDAGASACRGPALLLTGVV